MPTDRSADRFEVAPSKAVPWWLDLRWTITSDAGALLLGATDRAIGLVRRFAACFVDHRAAAQVEHSLATWWASACRFGVGLRGSARRRHPAPRPGAGRHLGQAHRKFVPIAPPWPASRPSIASSTRQLARRRATTKSADDAAAIERLFVDLFLNAYAARPEGDVLDLHATDDPLHGRTGGAVLSRLLWLLTAICRSTSSAATHLLVAKLRRANIDASAGAVAEVNGSSTNPCPLARSAGSFCAPFGLRREALMVRREANGVDDVSALARNPRRRCIAAESALAKSEAEQTGKAGAPLQALPLQTLDSWSRERRVGGQGRAAGRLQRRAECQPDASSSPRSAPRPGRHRRSRAAPPRRGEMENRIKERRARPGSSTARPPKPCGPNQLPTLVRGHGLCSDRSPAPDRAPDDPARPGHGGNHSTAAARRSALVRLAGDGSTVATASGYPGSATGPSPIKLSPRRRADDPDSA